MKPVIALALLASAALAFTATTSAKHHHPKPPGIVGGGIGLVAPAVNKHGIAPASPEPQTTCNESGRCDLRLQVATPEEAEAEKQLLAAGATARARDERGTEAESGLSKNAFRYDR